MVKNTLGIKQLNEIFIQKISHYNGLRVKKKKKKIDNTNNE